MKSHPQPQTLATGSPVRVCDFDLLQFSDRERKSDGVPFMTRCTSVESTTSTSSSNISDNDEAGSFAFMMSASSISDSLRSSASDSSYEACTCCARPLSADVEEEDLLLHQRSIFGRYWEKKGIKPVPLRRVSDPCIQVSHHKSSLTVDATGSEPPLRRVSTESSSIGSPQRRSVLGKVYPSYSSLPSVPSDLSAVSTSTSNISRHPALNRKSFSSGELSGRSCLREARFSGSKLRSSGRSESSSSVSSSVKFDPKVDVRHFQRPLESWSAGGWTEHFTQ